MKAIVFDFDGTLTYKSTNVWRALWKEIGESVGEDSKYRELYRRFMRKEISHQEWCDLTCEVFKAGGVDKAMVNKIARWTWLMPGAEDTFRLCKKRGLSLNIVSGSVCDVIYKVLGDNVKYFDSITANKMIFDADGKLESIKGTKYDFEGKARFIERLCMLKGISTKDVVFVGNSLNDEWVSTTGCKTLCINPSNSIGAIPNAWSKKLWDVQNLKEILPHLNLPASKPSNKEQNY